MRLIVFWSSALSLNSAAVHCLSKAINVCSSVILVFVCAEAIIDVIATTNVSISIPVNFFISSSPFVVRGKLDRVEDFDFCASLNTLGGAQRRRSGDRYHAVLAVASF